MIWKKFKALGSDIILSADPDRGQKSSLDEAEQIIIDFEKRFSRFVDGNELSRLNDLSGQDYAGSDMMIDLLKKSGHLYHETNGIFDPTIIGSLEAIGYARSFDEVNKDNALKNDKFDLEIIQRINSLRPRMEELKIFGNILTRPKNFRLDLGGIGKGYIVDFLTDKIFCDIENFWISAGGDLLVRGMADNESGWQIGVQDPENPEHDKFIIKTKGEKLAVATSGVIKRKGLLNDFAWHHIIDPRNGLPVKNDILSVTVISTDTARADVFAKTVLILGPEDGLKFIEAKTDSACIIFLKNKEPIFSRNAIKYS